MAAELMAGYEAACGVCMRDVCMHDDVLTGRSGSAPNETGRSGSVLNEEKAATRGTPLARVREEDALGAHRASESMEVSRSGSVPKRETGRSRSAPNGILRKKTGRSGSVPREGDCSGSTQEFLRQNSAEEARETEKAGETELRKRGILWNLQRKMLGHVMARIEEAQKLLGKEMAENTDGLSAKRQQFTFRVNQLLWPWLKAMCRISDRTELRRIHEWWLRQGEPEMEKVIAGHVVYARFSTGAREFYIGETQGYTERVKRHAYETVRHGVDCTRPCKGCGEHWKYRKHRVAKPETWVMVPLACVRDRSEARQMEDLLRLRWKPTLNAVDKPYYLLKDTYARDFREVKKTRPRGRAPWQGGNQSRRPCDGATRQVTRYDSEAHTALGGHGSAYNLASLCEASEEKAMVVWVRPGYTDLTNWRRLRLEWGQSYVKVIRPDGTRWSTILAEWRPREEKMGVDFCVRITPVRTKIMDVERVIDDITQEQERMASYDEEHIAFLWRVRNSVARDKAFKWRQVLWTELQRRYEDLPRQPIEIRIPYLERIDIVKVKGLVREMIEAREWPSYLKEWHIRSFRVTTAATPTIENIMTNVTKPSWIKMGCQCAQLKKTCPEAVTVCGHVLMIGRDFILRETRIRRCE